MTDPAIWLALAACVVTCFFTACYLSLKTFNRKRLQELLEERGRGERFEPFIARLTRLQLLTGTLRVGVNMIVLLAVLYFVQNDDRTTSLLLQYLIGLLVAGALVSVFGVAIPTSWARYRSEHLLASSLGFLELMLKVMLPIANLLHLADPLVRRISGVQENQDNGDEQLSDELISVVEEHEQGAVDPEQREMIEAVVEFRSTTAGEIMTPRTDVAGIEVDATLEEIKRVILDEGHSRIPVYAENIDNIVGILYARDLIALLGTDRPVKLRDLLREALMVPESKPVRELLGEFKSRKVHIAIVLDEYGGTAGLVTIEDVLEELVGEIEDEYEPAEDHPAIRRVSEDTSEVDARVYIDDLNDELGLDLPEDEDYDTVGGFVFSTLGHIPDVGESFEYDSVRVTVTAAERTKVLTVRVEQLDKQAEDRQAEGDAA